MPRGAAVIRYEGPRGVSWRIEYADADGRQVMETVGRERDGFTRKQAEAELRERLVNVERRGWRKPAPTTFEEYADEWFERGKTNRGWKPATVMATRTRLGHLKENLGPRPIASIRPLDVAAYRDERLRGFNARTVNVHLNLLHDVMKGSVADELIAANPVAGWNDRRLRGSGGESSNPERCRGSVTRSPTTARGECSCASS